MDFLRQTFSRRQLLLAASAGVLAGVAAAMLHPLLTVLAAIAGAACVLIAFEPYCGLVGVFFFLPFEHFGAYDAAFGTVRISQVLLAVTIVSWCFHAVVSGERPRKNLLLVPLLLFLAVNTIGLSRAMHVHYSSTVLVVTAFTMMLALLVPQLARTQERLRGLVVALLAGALLTGLFGIFQFFGDLAGLPTTVTGLRDLYTKDVFGFPRVQSTALEPLYFANYLLLPLSLLFVAFLDRRPFMPRWLALGGFGLLLLDLGLTISRGGYLGAAAALLFLSVALFRRILRLRVLVPLVIAGALLFSLLTRFIGYGDLSGLRVETFTNHVVGVFYGPSYNERVQTITDARDAFWRSPWVGVGPGGFGPFVAADALTKPKDGWKIVNNEPIELLAETGLLGFLAIAAAAVLLFLRSFKAFRAPRSFAWLVMLAGTGALLGVLVQYQTFSTLYIMHVWALVGLLLAAQNLVLERRHE